jgi:squalene cyclase
VLEGLRWLIRHQNPDGSWSAATLKDRCAPESPCFDVKEDYHALYDEGVTALALLCFLGAGYSHESKQNIVDTVGAKRYKVGEVIKNGLMWLTKRQESDGHFTRDKAFMYNESLATMALAEAYG